VFLAGLVRGEVQVLDGDGEMVALGEVQQADQGVADLGVAVGGGAGEVVAEAERGADRVAVRVQAPGGEVVGVGVDPDHPVCAGRRKRHRGGRGEGPGGGEVPAAACRVLVDAVGDGPVDADAVAPLLAPVRERHPRGEDVAAVRGVGQVRERGGEFEGDFTVGGDADGLVAVPLPRLPIGLQEPAPGLPPGTPIPLAEPGRLKVVAGGQQSLAAAHDMHDPGLPVGPRRLKPVFQDAQAAGLGMPLAP
jgi:hypothetical protein